MRVESNLNCVLIFVILGSIRFVKAYPHESVNDVEMFVILILGTFGILCCYGIFRACKRMCSKCQDGRVQFPITPTYSYDPSVNVTDEQIVCNTHPSEISRTCTLNTSVQSFNDARPNSRDMILLQPSFNPGFTEDWEVPSLVAVSTSEQNVRNNFSEHDPPPSYQDIYQDIKLVTNHT